MKERYSPIGSLTCRILQAITWAWASTFRPPNESTEFIPLRMVKLAIPFEVIMVGGGQKTNKIWWNKILDLQNQKFFY